MNFHRTVTATLKSILSASVFVLCTISALTSGSAYAAPREHAVPFTPAALQPLLDNLESMLRSMKAVNTAKEAQAFTDKLKQVMPQIAANVKRYNASHKHAARALHSPRHRTSEARAAGTMANVIAAKGAEVEQQRGRIEKLYPASKPVFAQFEALFN